MNRTNITPLRTTPCRLVAQVFSWEVEQTERQVEALGDEGGEGRGQSVFVVPIEHLEIKRVGGHHALVNNLAETSGHILCQRRHGQARTDHRVGKKCQVSARGAHGRNPAAVQRSEHVQHLERFHERFQRADSCHAEAIEEVADEGIGAGQRCRVGDDDLLGNIRPAGLDGDNGLPQIAGDVDRLLEGLWVGHRFEIEPQRRDPFLTRKHEHRVLELELELVPQGHHVGDRQSSSLHRKVEGDVGGCRNDGHTLLHPPSTLLIRPQHRAVEIVEEPIAVRSHEGHIARRLEQLLLELGSFITRFGEAGGIADGAPSVPGGEIADDIDGEVAVDTNVGGVRAARKFLNRAVDLASENLVLLGMDRPDLAVIPHAITLADDLLGLIAAKYCDGTRFYEALE